MAQSRTINAIRAIRGDRQTGQQKSHYQYDEADVKEDVGALNQRKSTRSRRACPSRRRAEVEFKL